MTRDLLVTLADQNFVAQAKQLFSSVYWNAGWRGDYMLLACEISETELKWFRNKRILVKEVKAFCDKSSNDAALRYPATVTSKLRLFSEEFKAWRTVVFIDADCIVRYPLDSLLNTRGFAATRDWMGTAMIVQQATKPESMDESVYLHKFNGYDLTATAFNTGVFVFNTEIIDGRAQAKLKGIRDKYRDLSRFGEQLWMNLYFYMKWERLPMEYNLFASYLHTKRRVPKKHVDGVVLHFPRYGNEEGMRCWERNNAFLDEWKRNLDRAEGMDLEHIPKPGRKWSRWRCLCFSRWRSRFALRGDYLSFYKEKISIRKRAQGVLSALKSIFG
jgi:lipopolysaccharide biosynthesis glycosyltransferase